MDKLAHKSVAQVTSYQLSLLLSFIRLLSSETHLDDATGTRLPVARALNQNKSSNSCNRCNAQIQNRFFSMLTLVANDNDDDSCLSCCCCCRCCWLFIVRNQSKSPSLSLYLLRSCLLLTCVSSFGSCNDDDEDDSSLQIGRPVL